ncbi:MAG: hypothetical protein RL030_1760 [Pseudomonadota bacterium]|jgi:hypothetical protein
MRDCPITDVRRDGLISGGELGRRNIMSEDSHQIALFDWAAIAEKQWPELRWLFHSPNGGKRDGREAVKLKRMGVKPGVADVFLPAPRAHAAGLWTEIKVPAGLLLPGKPRTPAGKVTKSQQEFGNAMLSAGYQWFVAYGWEQARDIIVHYLRSPK